MTYTQCKHDGCLEPAVDQRGMYAHLCEFHKNQKKHDRANSADVDHVAAVWAVLATVGNRGEVRSPVIHADHLVHGTYDGYTNHGCRCKGCTEASREYQRANYRAECIGGCGRLVWVHTWGATGMCRDCTAAERRAKRKPRHGTETEYSYGCRCTKCRATANAARRRRRFLNPLAQAKANAKRMERYYREKDAA